MFKILETLKERALKHGVNEAIIYIDEEGEETLKITPYQNRSYRNCSELFYEYEGEQEYLEELDLVKITSKDNFNTQIYSVEY